MAIAFRSQAGAILTGAVGAGGSLVINKPAGVLAGDVLIAVVTTWQTISGAPAGWTLLGSGTGVWFLHKIAGAAEPASYSFSLAGAYGTPLVASGIIAAFSGADSIPPLYGFAGHPNPGSGVNPLSAPSLAGVNGGLLIVCTGGLRADAAGLAAGVATPPAGMTERGDYATAAVSDGQEYAVAYSTTTELSTLTLTVDGATGDKGITFTNPVTHGGAASIMLAQPAAAGGPRMIV
jgi:hypothetical protein